MARPDGVGQKFANAKIALALAEEALAGCRADLDALRAALGVRA